VPGEARLDPSGRVPEWAEARDRVKANAVLQGRSVGSLAEEVEE